MPHGFRAALPVIVVIALAATYPYYVSSLPTDVPVILAFPDVGACVTIIIFVMMAVGLNIVVGYAGLLDLGYVAFYAIGAYTAGWLASGQFQQVRVPLRFGRDRQGAERHPHLDLARAALRGDPHRLSAGSSSACRHCGCAATTWQS